MTFDKDTGFSVIQNNGRESGYSQKCLFISILDWFRININQSCPLEELSLHGLVNMAGPFPEPIDMMWDSDRDDHMRYLLKICKLLNIHIHVYYVNSGGVEPSTHFWLGNPQPILNPMCGDELVDPNRIIPIVAWGAHFELLISSTSTTRALTIPQTFNHRVKHYMNRVDSPIYGSRKRKSIEITKTSTIKCKRRKPSTIKCKRRKKNDKDNLQSSGDSSMLENHNMVAKNVENISYYLNLIESCHIDHRLYNNYKKIIELLIESTEIETDEHKKRDTP